MNLRRNIFANYAGQLWTSGMAVAFLPVYIRILGTEAYGLVGSYTLLQTWLVLFELGLSPLLNREMARFTAGAVSVQHIRNLLRSSEILVASIASAIVAALWLGSGWITDNWLQVESLPRDTVVEALTLIAVVVGLRFCEGIYRTTLLGLQRQVLYNVINGVSATARWAGSAGALLFISSDIQVFFIWQAIVSAGSVLALAVAANTSLPKPASSARFDRHAFADVWRFAAGMVSISLLSVALLHVDKLLVSRMIPLSEFAHYSFAATVTGVLALLAGPISQAYYPRLTHFVAQNNVADERLSYHEASQLLAWIVVPPSIVLAAFSAPLLMIWTGDPSLVDATHTLVTIFALGAMFNSLLSMPYMLQLAHGWTRLSIYVNLGAVFFLVIGISMVAPQHGAVGTALMWLAVISTYGQVTVAVMHRRLLRDDYGAWWTRAWLVPNLAAGSLTLLLRSTIAVSDHRLFALVQIAGYGALVFIVTGAAMPRTRKMLAGAMHRITRSA